MADICDLSIWVLSRRLAIAVFFFCLLSIIPKLQPTKRQRKTNNEPFLESKNRPNCKIVTPPGRFRSSRKGRRSNRAVLVMISVLVATTRTVDCHHTRTILRRSISTRITDLFGCDYPLILPGMSWISTPPLVAAVTRAGGMGILATGPLSEEETRMSIRDIRERLNTNTNINNTSQKQPQRSLPFGVGYVLLFVSMNYH